jgi:hypothetical protein
MLSRFEIDVISMRHDQVWVGIQDIEKCVQLIREQDVVVGAKRAVSRFDRCNREADLLMDRRRGIVDIMHDIQPSPADRLAVLRQGVTRAGVEHTDWIGEPPGSQISEQPA